MDRLIKTAWRAFWVGLGASAVLISQSLLAPAPATTAAPHDGPAMDSAPTVASPKVKTADPILSRNPFDSTHGNVVAHVRGGQS